jgi:hypothetical protein
MKPPCRIMFGMGPLKPLLKQGDISFAWPGLPGVRGRRILSTCWGSVMTARIRTGNRSGYLARGSRCPLRGQLPPARSTLYAFASGRAQAEWDLLSDTD